MSITLIIIAITCLFSFLCFNNGDLFTKMAHYPYYENRSNEKYRWLTSGFLHVDLFHLFINMFVLYNFGSFVEQKFIEIHGESMGKIIFFSFYLSMVIFANLPTFSKYKNNASYRAVGASGAVAAVLFSFIVFEPLAQLNLYLFIPIPAVIFGVLYLWFEHWSSKNQRDNIGHDAHFYGALAGFAFTIVMKPSLISDFFFQIKNVLN